MAGQATPKNLLHSIPKFKIECVYYAVLFKVLAGPRQAATIVSSWPYGA